MATNSTYLQVATSNAIQFSNASNNDAMMYSTNSAQQMLIGAGTTPSLAFSACNMAMAILGNTSNSAIEFNFTSNNTSNLITPVRVLGNGCIGVGSIASQTNALLNIADYDGTSDPTQYGLAQLNHNSGGLAGKSNQAMISVVRTGNTIFGFGYAKGNSSFGIGQGVNSNIDFSPSLLTLDSNANGCVGIGSTTPSFPLDVAGALRVSGVNNAGVGTTGPYIFTHSTDDATRPRMAIQSFSVNNQAIYFDSCYTGLNAAYSSTGIAPFVIAKANNLTFNTANPGTQGSSISWVNALTLNSVGNVGIGTTNPTSILSVGGGAADTTSRIMINTADGDKILMTAPNTSGSRISHSTGNSIDFKAGAPNSGAACLFTFQTGTASGYAERMRIAYNGNIGIGTNNPQQVLDVVGHASFTGSVCAGNLGMFRNRIINGEMRFAQRGTTLTTGTGVGIIVDRFRGYMDITTGAITQTQQTLTSSDTPFASGFQYSLRFTATTACTSYLYILPTQHIEGANMSDFSWGLSGGSTITVSFWFKTNAATNSIFSVSLRSNAGTTYCYVTNITVTSSGAWQYCTCVIPPPPTGSTWNVDNAAGLTLFIAGYQSGSLAPTPNTWLSGNYIGSTTSTNIFATLNNYVEITGVQLEKGTIATPFEFRGFQTELELCQRYYEKSFALTTVPSGSVTAGLSTYPTSYTSTSGSTAGYVNYKVAKRNAGTFSLYSGYSGGAANTTLRIPGGSDVGVASTYAMYNGGYFTMSSTTPYAYYAHYTADCEF